jgi:Zn-dependent membrane protease YugP
MYFDPMSFVFMIPALILVFWAQSKVKGAYSKYRQVPNSAGATGAQAARAILDANGLQQVSIEQTPGELSDHYDPRTKVLRLSPEVYSGRSIASIGIAAHESGHAIQDKQRYKAMEVRSKLVPVANIGSTLGMIMLIAGILLSFTGLAWAGVALFAMTTVFALVTLPVEFDASKRAKVALVNVGIINDTTPAGQADSAGVKKMLDAAAWTYVAGFLASLLNLLYYVSLLTGGRRSN